MKLLRLVIALLTVHGPQLQAAEVAGTVKWANPEMLAFAVTGVVSQVTAKPGERVEPGQELARLDQRPFQIAIKKHQARVEVLKPLFEDAQREYEHARELYEQTVLSEVELQKKHALMANLEAQQEVARQDLALARWQLQQSRLIAPASVMLISSNLRPGMVISAYNQAQAHILVAETSLMAVEIELNAEQRGLISMGQKLEVKIGDQQLNARVSSITSRDNESSNYRVVVEFNPNADQPYFSGQQARVVY